MQFNDMNKPNVRCNRAKLYLVIAVHIKSTSVELRVHLWAVSVTKLHHFR